MSIFTSIRGRKPQKSKFDLSHERKFSFRMGMLTPVMVQDIVPGDKFRVRSEVFIRMAPMLAPIMHRVNVYTHYFFVPNRLVWDEWEDFITGGRDGSANPVPPSINYQNIDPYSGRGDVGSLLDYMGLPILPTDHSGAIANTSFSALPFRAYQLIYDQYFRDQNLQEELVIPKTSGDIGDVAELAMLLELRRRAWEKDYFTSALPWAQRGGDVNLPFEANVNYKDISEIYYESGTSPAGNGLLGSSVIGGKRTRIKSDLGNEGMDVRIENIDSIDGGPITINELRRSVRLQEWLEKNARGGARYVEQILSHFGVRSSDARLQRPEYLGGGKQAVQISEVLQTMQESGGEGNPLGAMGGHGVAVGNSNGFSKFFEEHGYVIGIMSVLPKTAYQQGIPKHFTREDKFDYAWPEFAQLGEQEIKSKEVYCNPAAIASGLEDTFGYQSRYAEYKFQSSSVHGEFRDSLAFWHMGRIFNSRPVLNASFVEADPTERIFAVAGEEHMYCQLYNSVSAIRPLPYFGTPTL